MDGHDADPFSVLSLLFFSHDGLPPQNIIQADGHNRIARGFPLSPTSAEINASTACCPRSIRALTPLVCGETVPLRLYMPLTRWQWRRPRPSR